jgi:2-succinyl-5-enolpyruvyl-6-hydroxy-3-cyclohexene-1-carboxylate synthase
MVYSSIPLAQAVITLCLSKGIDHVVISPGSRNAPLTIGFSHHPKIQAYSIVDERCAAFFALGLSQQLQRPVALCCTSGSALLNYYPAIAEAFYSDIPLVILSADRPIERIDIGDGQTIRQRDVYKNHILYSANLYSELVPEEASADQKLRQKQREATTHNQQEINKALNTAIEENGPVHVNIPFYEPLYNMTTEAQPAPINVAPKVKKEELSAEELQPFAKTWNAAKKKIVLVGVLPPDAVEKDLLEILAHDPSVLVFTETTSNLHHPNFFTRTDNLIGSLDTDDFKQLQPDLLVTFGGMVISKKIKAFLRNYQPQQHWHIDPKKAYDTYFCLNRHFEIAPNSFWKHFLPLTQFQKSDYFDTWNTVKHHRDQKHEEYLKEMQWCDFKAFQMILSQLPKENMLQLGNSSTVRYVQLFDIDKSLKVYCNRGTSGIDGSTSTAIGAAVGSQLPTTLIAGDLSFFYDSNALWNKYIPKNFKIIVINNGGGGIFRILPGNKDTEEFTDFFETTHDLSARHLAEMYDFAYYHAADSIELKRNLISFYEKNVKPSILEISTPRTINDKVLLNYFSFIR